MRAVVMQAGEITVEEIDEPQLDPGQVLLAPHYSGICGSDLLARYRAVAIQSFRMGTG